LDDADELCACEDPEGLRARLGDSEPYHLNPYYYGVDGSQSVSGAGVAYFFATGLAEENRDLSPIALIGAAGDLQNKGPKGQFGGLNARIVEDALRLKLITAKVDLGINRHRGLVYALAYTLIAPLAPLADDRNAAKQFLEGYGITYQDASGEERCLLDMSLEERKALIKALINLAEENNVENSTNALFRTFYCQTRVSEDSALYDLSAAASLLNACGRSKRPELGIAAALGNMIILPQAVRVAEEYSAKLGRAIKAGYGRILSNSTVLRILYGGHDIEEEMIGTVATLLANKNEFKDRPLVAYADQDAEFFKVSLRASDYLVGRGLNMGVIVCQAAKAIEEPNPAGGHPPAAGGKIPKLKMKQFLTHVEALVAERLQKPSVDECQDYDQEEGE
jgi:RecJ-like exonuclease